MSAEWVEDAVTMLLVGTFCALVLIAGMRIALVGLI